MKDKDHITNIHIAKTENKESRPPISDARVGDEDEIIPEKSLGISFLSHSSMDVIANPNTAAVSVTFI
jgi:hypothetical protein